MVDLRSLNAEIVRNGLTKEKVAQSLNLSSRTFYTKMKTGNFDVKEATALVELLNIEEPQKIFFAKEIS